MSKINSNDHLKVGFTVFFLFVLNACGEEGEKESSLLTKPVLPQMETSVPSSDRLSVHPPVDDETRDIYQFYCAQCHGVEGRGNGINSKYVTVPPLNHTKPDYLETRTDQELFDAIRLGGLRVGRAPCMPAWGHTLKEEMMWSLVRYIRELCQCEAV